MYKTYKHKSEILMELPYKILKVAETKNLMVVTVELETGKIANVRFTLKHTKDGIELLNVEAYEDDLKLAGYQFPSLEDIMELVVNEYDVIRGAIIYNDIIFELDDRYLFVSTKPIKNGFEVVRSVIKMK